MSIKNLRRFFLAFALLSNLADAGVTWIISLFEPGFWHYETNIFVRLLIGSPFLPVWWLPSFLLVMLITYSLFRFSEKSLAGFYILSFFSIFLILPVPHNLIFSYLEDPAVFCGISEIARPVICGFLSLAILLLKRNDLRKANLYI